MFVLATRGKTRVSLVLHEVTSAQAKDCPSVTHVTWNEIKIPLVQSSVTCVVYEPQKIIQPSVLMSDNNVTHGHAFAGT